MNHEVIHTWKVETTAAGVMLTINGKRYFTASGESIAFDLDRAARGLNAPPVEHREGSASSST